MILESTVIKIMSSQMVIKDVYLNPEINNVVHIYDICYLGY